MSAAAWNYLGPAFVFALAGCARPRAAVPTAAIIDPAAPHGAAVAATSPADLPLFIAPPATLAELESALGLRFDEGAAADQGRGYFSAARLRAVFGPPGAAQQARAGGLAFGADADLSGMTPARAESAPPCVVCSRRSAALRSV